MIYTPTIVDTDGPPLCINCGFPKTDPTEHMRFFVPEPGHDLPTWGCRVSMLITPPVRIGYLSSQENP